MYMYQPLFAVDSFANMRTENTDQLCLGHWLIEADRRCGQMSVEFDMDRLAATAIKLHSIHTCACTFTHCR